MLRRRKIDNLWKTLTGLCTEPPTINTSELNLLCANSVATTTNMIKFLNIVQTIV